jgi:hypothetical protein
MNELRISHVEYALLSEHLFPGDRDEHGALLLVGTHQRADRSLLMTVREVHPLSEHEFPQGVYGYRQFAASALARLANRAADENLALVSAHSHPGAGERTGLSADDLAAHERVFEHLLDITGAPLVGGIALGERSAAGEIWTRDERRLGLHQMRVIGANINLIQDRPQATTTSSDQRFDRQVRLFGDLGQARLRGLDVAVIGAGGGGSILVEQLAHLGVGRITIIDPDVVKRHNLSRVMGASASDARRELQKVAVAKRHVKQIDATIQVEALAGDVADLDVARRLLECDYMFLATDTITARLVANAIAVTFLIPLIQIGAKVDTNQAGELEQIYTAVRPVMGRRGCLYCAGLIDPVLVARETATPEERRNQNYLGADDIVDPSVTTLNAAAAADALNVFLMGIIGQADDGLANHRITLTREGTRLEPKLTPNPECRWCGTHAESRYARANADLLPCRWSSTRPTERHTLGRLLRDTGRKLFQST